MCNGSAQAPHCPDAWLGYSDDSVVIAMIALLVVQEQISWPLLLADDRGIRDLHSVGCYAYLDWNNDYHVVTDRRVAHIERCCFSTSHAMKRR